MKTKLIAVAGPTASGKTSLAVSLAKALCGEVVSCDSMQIYRGMEIGTAAATAGERAGIPHHMIGIAEPDSDFSCADYAAAAAETIGDIAARGKMPVICGGTGLYLDSLLSVGSFSESVKDTALRERLTRFAEENGAEALHKRLELVDAESAAAIHKNNIRRVIRAIEIYETSGVTKTEWDARSLEKEPPYEAAVIVLEFQNRELLYRRIDRRVDAMLEGGLEYEVKRLWDKGLLQKDKPAWQAIGYKEFEPYFRGEAVLSEVAEAIKQNTRRYAKRQITWFHRNKNAIIVHPDENGEMRLSDSIAEEALEKAAEKL